MSRDSSVSIGSLLILIGLLLFVVAGCQFYNNYQLYQEREQLCAAHNIAPEDCDYMYKDLR
jgi:uncharacterized membrane protein YidH (DUF202 family)